MLLRFGGGAFFVTLVRFGVYNKPGLKKLCSNVFKLS